jgi:predicted glycosyltransferase
LNRSYNILICPLEWGLGHAARMIPLSMALREMNNKIIIGSGEEHLALFRKEMPGVSCLNFSGFHPGYSRFLPQYLSMLLKTPLLLYHIVREHFMLKKIIREHSIDIVISDNRFGLWNRKITTVYVTHMPLIPFPKPFRSMEFIGKLLHRSVIKKYSYCFIPDLPGDLNLSGRLSHGLKLPDNVRYTGILSRFNTNGQSAESKTEIFKHNTVILSGPEPQRGILKQKLTAILKDKAPVTVILEGNPHVENVPVKSGNIIFINHLITLDMKKMISESQSIITRSGYTTIMELISLNCSALLIPTPGQTEQEYLAEYLSEKGWFCTLRQNQIDDKISLPSTRADFADEIMKQSNFLLKETLKELLEEQHKKYETNKTR